MPPLSHVIIACLSRKATFHSTIIATSERGGFVHEDFHVVFAPLFVLLTDTCAACLRKTKPFRYTHLGLNTKPLTVAMAILVVSIQCFGLIDQKRTQMTALIDERNVAGVLGRR